MEQIKLNLGCGDKHIEGYENIDIDPACSPDLILDVSTGLPYDDNSVDMVRAFDFLEHIKLGKTIFVINEIYRVLKKDGFFESFTPDAEHGQGAFQDPTHVSFWCENSWIYYSNPDAWKQYRINANFEIQSINRVNTHSALRIFHLHVVARAAKHE